MKIIILGHSNSILKDGWLSHLRQLRPDHEYVNLSIGGSPSPALLYQAVCHRDALRSADLIVVEPTVVDHGEQWQSGPGVAGHAGQLFGWLRSVSTAPILLLILPRTEAWLKKPSQGMQAWYALARRHGVQVVDGRTGIVRYCADAGLELAAAWRDNMGHTVAPAQLEVARDVAQALDEARPPLAPATAVPPGAGFRVLHGSDMAARHGLELRCHTTALLTSRCAVLAGAAAIALDSEPEDRLLGIAVNFGALNPVEPVTFRVEGLQGRTSTFKISNPFMGRGPLHKPYVMFTATHVGHDAQQLSIDAPDQARFAPGAAECIELAGVLLGPAIAPIHDLADPDRYERLADMDVQG